MPLQFKFVITGRSAEGNKNKKKDRKRCENKGSKKRCEVTKSGKRYNKK